ncbi:GNAT family N-acetyltransferase [Kribbella sp. NBC_00889]|uniref:GNAT family N-acetyltransferase n=1 Tax=Kribbella sp. NBC_00889 TaxID=2975974 RepID=UPI00386552A8|nr:GNAT family N-acetyltransferase [Kribbella sp. NBC_00889]
MDWPAGVTTRPLRPEDVPAVVEVANAIAEADQSGQYVTAEGFSDAIADLDLAKDSMAVCDADGLAGYGLVDPPQVRDGQSVAEAKGGIHPRSRRTGLGGPLLAWQTNRARERAADVVDVEVEAIATGALAMLASQGFQPVRYFEVMRRWYDDQPVSARPLPAGFTIIRFEPSYDERLRLAHNEIFRDHWGVSEKDDAAWRRWFTGSRHFRAEWSSVVLDADRVAAYAFGYEFPIDTERTGYRELWIGQVGTRREYRCQGLARAAISTSLRIARTDGCDRSALGVDVDSPTGATRLYDSLGFKTVSRTILHRLSLVRRSAPG